RSRQKCSRPASCSALRARARRSSNSTAALLPPAAPPQRAPRRPNPPPEAALLPKETMTAQILDGNALGRKLRAGFKARADELAAQGMQPGLAVILVGENP